MKISSFIIFFTIVILIYSAVNYFIFKRGLQAIPENSGLKIYYIFLFIFISSSYLLGRLFERIAICDFSNILIKIGSFWLAAMLYFLLLILIFDLIRLLNHFIHFYPAIIKNNYINVKFIIFNSSAVFVSILIFWGYYNASTPTVNKVNFKINKKTDTIKHLNIAVVSDIHAGTIIKNSKLENLVNKINELNPDIVFLVGDMVDEDIEPVIKNNLGEIFKSIKSKYGTVGVLGNHEYIGNAKRATKYLTEHNINILKDSSITLNNEITIIGRDDLTGFRFSGNRRKPLQDLLVGTDTTKPIIVLDHQPFYLTKVAELPIDLQISGHTHHGQLFPFNYITEMIYELSWGYKKINNTHFYVSCGFGTWGPPIKIGNVSEIVNINLEFE